MPPSLSPSSPPPSGHPGPPTDEAHDRHIASLHRPVGYVRKMVMSAVWPFRGMWYCLTRPAFYPIFRSRLLPLSILSFVVYFILFTFAFLPQLAFLAIFQGPGAWVNAVVLVLGEGLAVIQGLFEGFFVDECQVDVFDAVLIDKGFADLIAPYRLLFSDAPNPVKMLGKPTRPAEYSPFSIIQTIELIVFLPLNLIPVIGTPAFIIITGTRLGKLSHYRWYKLRGLTRKQKKKEIKSRLWEYIWFGTATMTLQLIPVLSFVFLLTSAAGSALWVAKMESARGVPEGQASGGPDAPAAASSTDQFHESGVVAVPYRDHPSEQV